MSISTITIGGQSITLVSAPTTAVLRTAEWNLYDAVAVVPSEFSARAQRHWWPGADKWSGTMTYPPLTRAQMDDVTSFLMQLRGRANAFQLGDPLHTAPRGSGSGLPFVDNTPGTNLPGAITLATAGWTANAGGVLLRGDQIQVGYRLYQVLDDVNADASGKAVLNIWPSLRETPFSSGGGLPFLNATASATMTRSASLDNLFNGALWSDFSTPALPADALITGIYPVMIASAHHDQAFSSFQFGPGLNLAFHGGLSFDSPFDGDNTSFSSTEFYYFNANPLRPLGYGLGTSLSLLAGMKMQAMLYQSEFVDLMTDTLDVTAVGIAVYYTSAAPVIDPQIAAPFTVPAGSGVAWSLPFSVATTRTTDTGTAVGTPAIDNGGIILHNPKGLWALSSNKRGYSEDGSKGTNATTSVSFPLEEYIAG